MREQGRMTGGEAQEKDNSRSVAEGRFRMTKQRRRAPAGTPLRAVRDKSAFLGQAAVHRTKSTQTGLPVPLSS